MIPFVFILLLSQTLGQILQANEDTFAILVNNPTCLDVMSNDVTTGSSSIYQVSNGTQGGWSMLNAKFHLGNTTGVIFEVEDHNTINDPGSVMSGISWYETTDYPNISGVAFRTSDSTVSAGDDNYGRMISFKIGFTVAGNYTMWARGKDCTACISGSCNCGQADKADTVHALTYLPNGTIDLITEGNGNPIKGFGAAWEWGKSNNITVVLKVTPGELFPPYLKTFFLAVREDGFVVDRVALMSNPSVDLTNWGSSIGSPSSRWVQCSANQILYIPPSNWTGKDTVQYVISNGVNTSNATINLYVGIAIPSPSVSPSSTPTPSSSVSPSSTPTRSSTPTASPSVSPSSTPTPNPSSSSSPSPSTSPTTTSSMTSNSSTPSSSATPSYTSTSPSGSSSDSSNSNSSSLTGIYVAVAIFGAAVLGIVIAIVLVFKRKAKKRRDDKADMELTRMPSDDKWEIGYQELTIGNQIGSGAFGNVFKARWRNCDCVVKQLNSTNQNAESVAQFLKEAHIVKNLRNHENVCSIFGVCTNPQYPICIVLEYVAGGSLQNLIYDHKLEMTGPLLIQFAKNICSGMSHIHKENLLHCDLACRNLLISHQGKDKYVLKITDFGLARISDKGFYDAKEEARFPIRWTAPEVLMNYKVSRASDVWSFGVVLWEMIEGKVPWYGLNNTEVVDLVCKQNQRLPKPSAKFEYPVDETYAVMVQCWQVDPQARPSFDELFQKFENLERMWGYNQEEEFLSYSSEIISDNSGNSIGVPDYLKARALANFSIESNVTYGNKDV